MHRSSPEVPLTRSRYLPRRTGVSSSFDPLRDFSFLPAPAPTREEKARSRRGLDASGTMSAWNIVGHHTGARFAMIPRVINNVCFNVNLRLGSNLISTEATRSNADGDWLGGIGTQRRTSENVRRERRGERGPRGYREKGRRSRNERERERERGKRRIESGRGRGGGRRRTRRAARHCSRPLARDS